MDHEHPRDPLYEAHIHIEAARRWLRYGIEGRAPADLAAIMCLHHRLRAVGWLVGAPPFTIAA